MNTPDLAFTGLLLLTWAAGMITGFCLRRMPQSIREILTESRQLRDEIRSWRAK